MWDFLNSINSVIWHDYVLYVVLGVGVLFTVWSGFGQFRALTHGVAVTRGKYDNKDDPGAINHFQALSAALSATVGLGNIAGVGVAVALGGPGAVFWMWIVGLLGMAIKMTEVTLSMLFRNTDDPDNPHGGPMWVAQKGFAKWGLKPIGSLIGGIFVITLLISTITGGNMFQAWSVGEITENYFKIPSMVSGIVLAVLVGMVIIGGIKRIGAVAGKIVPFMCAIYVIAAIVVLIMFADKIPGMLKLIVVEAFKPSEASGAFLGGTAGYALLWGMKRALFSSESGQGSSPIAHSAAKTDEPVREGIVAGLEPFIDTIVVCTMTALVILCTGTHNRGGESEYAEQIQLAKVDSGWVVASSDLPKRSLKAREVAGGGWMPGDDVFVVVSADVSDNTGLNLHRINGTVVEVEDVTTESGSRLIIGWAPLKSDVDVTVAEGYETALFADYPGPSLTGHAFDTAIPGLGKWLVTFAAWLFALSTMISWSYYGEQGIVYLFGERAVVPYKIVYCAAIIVAAWGFIKTDAQLDSITALGTGVMLWANIPIMLIFGATAMGAYHLYGKKLKAGVFHPHKAPHVKDVVEGKDHD